VLGYAPDEDRTTVRDEPDRRMLSGLAEQDQNALELLLDQMAEHWSLDGLTTLLYGIPKLIRGLPIDAPPTAELKVAQRAWFVMLYRLLLGKDTGPRLPTLLLALDMERVRTLLSA
jgi:lysyl-tRNA synthetase class 1